MKPIGHHQVAIAAAALLAFGAARPAHAQGSSMPTRHVRAAVVNRQAALVGPLAADLTLRLDLALPLRNEAELDALLQQLADPQSSSYRQYLSVAEFTDRFGPTVEDYDAVLRFAAANGLQVTATAPNRLLVSLTGTVASIERAFHVTLNVYQHPTEDRTFYAPDREPAADLPVALWHVTGLDNFSLPHPASLHQDAASVTANTTGSGPGGAFFGKDMRAAYYAATALTGAGQSVGVLELEAFNLSDVKAYFTAAGEPLTTTIVGVGTGSTCTGTCADAEAVADIVMAISMAPGLSNLYVYFDATSDVAVFNRMASDNKAKSLSCSWAWSPADPSSDDPIFKELSAQGQVLFVASGDGGAYTAHSIVYPADDVNVMAVGGTVLVTKSAGGAWKSETGWADSGGGPSPNKIAIPSYQVSIEGVNKASKTLRNVPDVALNAVGYYLCTAGTCSGGWNGTSFAAPLWAGYLALADQQAATAGLSSLGFINPTIYTIGEGTSYTKDFHDITSGSNGTYSCGPGYDLVTGWGTPNGANLINALVP
jgi:subtilase family serine protease